METQLQEGARVVQVTPESVLVDIVKPSDPVTSLVPSADDVIEYQPPPAGARCVQVTPESVDVKTAELYTTAASLVPSAEEVVASH